MCGRYALETPLEKLPQQIQDKLSPTHQKHYEQRSLIRPTEPVLTLRKEESKTQASLMLWGLLPSWSKNPFHKDLPKPFNARAETINDKEFFKGAWRHHRCLIPASCFYEKGHRIKPTNEATFWLAGIWDRWTGSDGSELDSCTIITTEPNSLIKPLHNRMPVIIPNGLEEEWISSVKNAQELKALKPLMTKWDPDEWKAEPKNKPDTNQLSFL